MPFRRMAAIFVSKRASWRRTDGSSSEGLPFLRELRASSFKSSRARSMPVASEMPERSLASAPITTFQPSPSWPRRFSTGTRASLKNTWLKLWLPTRLWMGCTSMPGVSIGTSRHVIHLATCAAVVQIFWPFTTYSSPSRTAFVCRDARSLPTPGSE